MNDRVREYTKLEDGINEYGQSFYSYMVQVDRLCMSKVGLSVFDLPDAMWWDYWNDGVPPKEALDDLLIEEGYHE